MGGEKKPLVMSELGCADGCGREMGAEKCADGCGRRGCKGVAGNGWGEEAAGDERAWLRGRLRTRNGCGELCGDGCGRRGSKGVAGNGWGEEAAGDERAWPRTAADGKWVRRIAQTVADGVGPREWLEMDGEKKPLVMSELGCADGCGRQMGGESWMAAWTAADGKWVRRIAWTAADGVGATEWLEMDGEKKPLVMSELGCAGRLRTGNGCGELRGRLRTAWVQRIEWLEMGGEKKPLVMSELGCADGCGREMGAENCADGCGRRGCKGVAGNGWGEEAADERAWLRGRLRTGNGCGELVMSGAWLRGRLRTGNGCGEVRGRLRTAWVQGSCWKWVGGNGGEKKPLVMSELGCADGCGRQMGAENGVDGCGRRGCKGVAGNGWGEEAADDERAWLRGRLRTGNGLRRIARTAADGQVVAGNGWGEEATEWLGKMGGEKKPLVMCELSCADCGREMGAENCATAWVQGSGDRNG